MTTSARLVAIDWGTSNLRASLLGMDARVLESRSTAGGVMVVPDGQFERTLMELCGDWIGTYGSNLPLMASGMIGSRQGWIEAPYVPCPATLAQVASQAVEIKLRGGAKLHIIPGLLCRGPGSQFDVMRGEETQLWGAELSDDVCCVLPGTHSKWARLGSAGTIESFQTYMTGELFALLTKNGILGRLMQFGHNRPEAFERGVLLGVKEFASATSVIFAARTAGLMSQVGAQELPDFLSGILIGIEIGSATRGGPPSEIIVLGDEGLGGRYLSALKLAGFRPRMARDDATIRGQWLLAVQAGLIRGEGA